MGLLRPSRLFLLLLALAAASMDTSAQTASDPVISDGQPVHDDALLLPLTGQLASNRIDGLLGLSGLRPRQQQLACATDFVGCTGTQFCCPVGNVCCPGGLCCGTGTYCTNVGGVQGCCRTGRTCNQITNQCTVQGQTRCPNENYCCDAGDTCYRDANNNPRCISGSVSVTSSTSIIPTPTSKSSLSSDTGHSGTTATPVPTSTSLPKQCQLKSTQPRSLFSRRRQPPVRPAHKRRSWFR